MMTRGGGQMSNYKLLRSNIQVHKKEAIDKGVTWSNPNWEKNILDNKWDEYL